MSRSSKGISRSLAFAVNDFERGWGVPVPVPKPRVCVVVCRLCPWLDGCELCGLVSWRYRSLRRCPSLKLFSWLLADEEEDEAVPMAVDDEDVGADDDELDGPEPEDPGPRWMGMISGRDWDLFVSEVPVPPAALPNAPLRRVSARLWSKACERRPVSGSSSSLEGGMVMDR